jgi:DNA invertase Pin-like site-specific DNA recombinase
MTVFGYARVSMESQTLDSEVEALKAAGCDKIFREKVSGARADRPQLLRLLAAIGSGDVLIVSRLDRLARSPRDLLNILDTLAARGAAFRSLGDQWADTRPSTYIRKAERLPRKPVPRAASRMVRS